MEGTRGLGKAAISDMGIRRKAAERFRVPLVVETSTQYNEIIYQEIFLL